MFAPANSAQGSSTGAAQFSCAMSQLPLKIDWLEFLFQ